LRLLLADLAIDVELICSFEPANADCPLIAKPKHSANVQGENTEKLCSVRERNISLLNIVKLAHGLSVCRQKVTQPSLAVIVYCGIFEAAR
jgi:hypothetical protein